MLREIPHSLSRSRLHVAAEESNRCTSEHAYNEQLVIHQCVLTLVRVRPDVEANDCKYAYSEDGKSKPSG